MSIFAAPEELDPRLSETLANRDRYAEKKLAKQQAAILSLLRPAERVVGIGVDVTGMFGISVVTNERVVQVKRGKVIHEAGGDRINRTRLLARSNGNYLVAIDGPGLYSPTFFNAEDANRFARSIDQYLIGSPPGPRDIPTLLPDFYTRILHTTAKPDTPENVVQIIIRVAQALIGPGALTFFDQLDDAHARTRFLARFSTDSDDDESLLTMPDDIIDWLWAWHPGCHDALRRMVPRIFEVMTAPSSFLWTCGDVVPELDD